MRFSFPPGCDRRCIEDDFAVALFTAECLYGRPRVRLEARYLVSDDGSRCVAEVHGPAGEAALKVFMGLAAARMGKGSYGVERVMSPVAS